MPNQPTNPLISVIMPAYNVEPFIGEAIRSIQNQTHQNWELLVINDASTDKTAQIAKTFAKHDKRIKVFSKLHKSWRRMKQSLINKKL